MRPVIDITGQRFGKLVVLCRVPRHEKYVSKDARWRCRCDCGAEVVHSGNNLRRGGVTHCGCSRKGLDNLVGRRFGRLLVLHRGEFRKKDTLWVCVCDCGNEITIPANRLKQGTQSCGCLRREINSVVHQTHGYSKTAEYRIWKAAIDRCENPKNKGYGRYGALGVKFHPEWRHSFVAFINHIGWRTSPDLTLDRYPDPAGNYEPGNVRWATLSQQANNKRKTKRYEFNGLSLTIKEWSDKLGWPYHLIFNRLRLGWDIEKALSTPKLR